MRLGVLTSPVTVISDVCWLMTDNNHLRLNRAVLESFDNFVLNFNLGATSGANVTGIGNGNIALVVDGLIGNGDEIASPVSGLG